jgi:5-formyltetrahydrofolate cyclo-ligase
MPLDLQQMRRDLKDRRTQLATAAITTASQTIANKFWRLPCVQRIGTVGIYMATAGEIDCGPLIKTGWLRKKRIFAPVLAKKQSSMLSLFHCSRSIKI